MNQHFFKVPFANAGDKTAVPVPAQGDGSMSYSEGYGIDYALDPATNPAALKLQRQQFNQLQFDMSSAIGALQIAGFPEFITAADNGGVAYPYAQNAYVRWSADGTGDDWAVFFSLVNNNTATPADATKWSPITTLTFASQADVNEGDNDGAAVGPVELVKAAREGRWIYAGEAVYATAQALTVAMPGTGAYVQTAGAQVAFQVPTANPNGPITLKLGPNATVALRTSTGQELVAGDLDPAALYTARFTGAEWRLENTVASQLALYGAAASGYIYGLQVANAPGALTTTISVQIGDCRDSTNTFSMRLLAPLTKRLDQVWAAGTGNGMRDNAGAPAALQTWHVFLIMNPVNGAVDILASQSATGPTLPAGYTVFRRIWSLILDPAASIRQFIQTGDYCSWAAPFNDYTGQASAGVNVFTLRKFTAVPNGVRVLAKLYGQSTDVGGTPDTNTYHWGLFDPANGPPGAYSATTAPGCVRRGWFYAYPGQWLSFETNEEFSCFTDTAQNMYEGSDDAFNVFAVRVLGYTDPRGRFF